MNFVNNFVAGLKSYVKAHTIAWRNPLIILITILTAFFFMAFHYLLFSSLHLLTQTGKSLGILNYIFIPFAQLFENTLQFFIVAAIAYYITNEPRATLNQSFTQAGNFIPSYMFFALIQYIFSRALFVGSPQLSLIVLLIDSLIRIFLLYYVTQFTVLNHQNPLLAIASSSKLVLKTILPIAISLAAAYGLVKLIHYLITLFFTQGSLGASPVKSKVVLFLDYFFASYLKIVTLGIFATLIYKKETKTN